MTCRYCFKQKTRLIVLGRKLDNRKVDFMAAGEACKFTVWPTPCLRDKNSDIYISLDTSTLGALIFWVCWISFRLLSSRVPVSIRHFNFLIFFYSWLFSIWNRDWKRSRVSWCGAVIQLDCYDIEGTRLPIKQQLQPIRTSQLIFRVKDPKSGHHVFLTT